MAPPRESHPPHDAPGSSHGAPDSSHLEPRTPRIRSGQAAHTPTVGFQGEIGAFSELAAQRFHPGGCEVSPLPTFEALFEGLVEGEIDRAVVPIENSLFGSVHTNYDLLRDHDVHIIAELKLRVRHYLLALEGTTLSDVKGIVSHPQALGQCRDFLSSRLPEAEVIPAYDTAGAAKMIARDQIGERAAIASRAAAEEYGLAILAEGIESNHENYTRFLLLQAGEARIESSSPEPHKTSIVWAMRDNVPGALFKSLAVFALRELDLLKIESRPLVGSPFEYLFYLDFRGRLDDEPVTRALEHLEEVAAYVKVLGSYPDGPTVE